MSEQMKTIPGYIRVATAAKLLGRSREWVYRLIEEGRLEKVEKVVQGRGLYPITLIVVQSFIDYVRSAEQYAGKRTAIINRARAEATHVQVRDFSEDDEKRMAERYLGGDSLGNIASDYDSSAGTVANILRKRGVSIRKASDYYQQQREAFVNSLPEETRNAIKTLYEQGEGPVKIAEEIGWGRGQHGKVKRVLMGLGIKLRNRSEAQKLVYERRKQVAA